MSEKNASGGAPERTIETLKSKTVRQLGTGQNPCTLVKDGPKKLVVKQYVSDELMSREVATLEKLKFLPGVQRVVYIFHDSPALVTEYAGRTLASIKETLSEEDKIEIFKQLVNLLRQLHARQIIHKNISPSHICVRRGKDNTVKMTLIDFSLARRVNEKQNEKQNLGKNIKNKGHRSDSHPSIDVLGVAQTIKTLFSLSRNSLLWRWVKKSLAKNYLDRDTLANLWWLLHNKKPANMSPPRRITTRRGREFMRTRDEVYDEEEGAEISPLESKFEKSRIVLDDLLYQMMGTLRYVFKPEKTTVPAFIHMTPLINWAPPQVSTTYPEETSEKKGLKRSRDEDDLQVSGEENQITKRQDTQGGFVDKPIQPDTYLDMSGIAPATISLLNRKK